MNPDELEALIGRLGTRGSTSLGDVVSRLVQDGLPVFPSLLRVLEERNYRWTLWEQYGKAHEGEQSSEFFPEHTLTPERYDKMLRWNVIHILGKRREFRQEPLHSRLRTAANQVYKEKYPGGRPDQPASDSEQGRWKAYLDACAALDVEPVRAYWQGGADDQNAADCGLGSALNDDTFGVSTCFADVVQFLLSRGGDIDVELHANIGCVALQYAAQDDDPERVRWLLSHGADVNRSDADGCTALMYALRNNGLVGPRDTDARRAVLRASLEAGADPEFQERRQYEDFEFVGPTLWEFADAEGEALLAEFSIFRPPDGADIAA